MNFDKEQSKKELAGAMEGILKEIRENGFKSFEDSQDDGMQKDMREAIFAVAEDAVTNPCTPWQGMRHFLWQCACEDALANCADELRCELEDRMKERLEC